MISFRNGTVTLTLTDCWTISGGVQDALHLTLTRASRIRWVKRKNSLLSAALSQIFSAYGPDRGNTQLISSRRPGELSPRAEDEKNEKRIEPTVLNSFNYLPGRGAALHHSLLNNCCQIQNWKICLVVLDVLKEARNFFFQYLFDLIIVNNVICGKIWLKSSS